jgi:hypothetical protein
LIAARGGNLFSEDSLFAKTLTNTLTPEQAVRYRNSIHDWQPSRSHVLRRYHLGKWQARMQVWRAN